MTIVSLAAGCGEADEATSATAASAADATGDDDDVAVATARLDEIAAAVTRWADAPSLGAAVEAAADARRLVTGGGEATTATGRGLLPTPAGAPGLVTPLASCEAVERDVLGGDWSDPGSRWAVATTAIEEWSPSNNTFPSLSSHPQRVVGWATLTEATTSLADAHEYAGHAQLHVDVSRAAVASC